MSPHDPRDAASLLPPALIILSLRLQVYKSYTHVPTYVCNMPRYLKFLWSCIIANGGTFHRREIESIFQAVEMVPNVALVVNCLGLGAAGVAGDEDEAAMVPGRGVLVYVLSDAVDAAYEDIDRPDQQLTYVVPQEGGVVACGGTSDDGDGDLVGRPEEFTAVLNRCREMLPALRTAPVIGQWVGLRPKRRGGIRLERSPSRYCRNRKAGVGVDILSNYGHGGSGIALSWGCAGRVAELAAESAARAGLGLDHATLQPGVGSSIPPPPATIAALSPATQAQLQRAHAAMARRAKL